MQQWVLNQKKYITLAGGLLIAAAFLSDWWIGNAALAERALIAASVLGVAPIAIQAFQALKVKVVSIDVLVTIAVLGAFLIREYEESAIVTFLFLFGAYLEMRTLNRTRAAIKNLTEMAPESALKQMSDGTFRETSIEKVDIGDVLLVKTGAKIPVDGTVTAGEGYVNEASITGESMPSAKWPGANVFAGTMLENGTLQVTAARVGEDTTFGKIIELVEEAQDSKSEAERFIDRFSKKYTPMVLVMAVAVGFFFRRVDLAITILVLGCPGALVIGVPVSNVAGIGNGARHGILLKGSEVIRNFSRADTFVFDKTGTLTAGNPRVTDVQLYTDEPENVFRYLAGVERESDHPLAKAIIEYLGVSDHCSVESTDVVKGAGILAIAGGHRIAVGNVALMRREGIPLTGNIQDDILRFEHKGNTLVLVSVDGELCMLMGIRDPVRPDVKEHLQRLRSLNVKNLIILSGDNQGTVDIVGREIGSVEAHGNMLPEDKARYISQLRQQGRIVAFVGDGVNDSPSLAQADIGIAMGNGTDTAIETSDVVLMNSDLGHLPHALGLAKAITRNMKQNIVIAVGVVIFLLANVFLSEWMNMSVGMLVHEMSILVVIFNGMRLLHYRLR